MASHKSGTQRSASADVWLSNERAPMTAYWHCEQALAANVRTAKREAKAAAGLILASELKSRRRVLRRLGCGRTRCASMTGRKLIAIGTVAAMCDGG